MHITFIINDLLQYLDFGEVGFPTRAESSDFSISGLIISFSLSRYYHTLYFVCRALPHLIACLRYFINGPLFRH